MALVAAPLASDDDADPTYTHFAHRTEFLTLLGRFLTFDLVRESSVRDDEVEEGIVASLGAILDFYLPLPGLLDPSMDSVVPPLMHTLSAGLRTLVDSLDSGSAASVNPRRLARLGRVINWVVKVRGWKAVVPHFPSSITNLPILVTLLSPPTCPSSSATPSTTHHPFLSSQDAWELRAVLLLWLALLLTVPFSLSALSSNNEQSISTTAYGIDLPAGGRLFAVPSAGLSKSVMLIAVPLLQKPGKEGAYAALVLSRLFSREDAVASLPGFFDWASAELRENERESEANFVASLFELLALLPSLLSPRHLPHVETFIEDTLLPHLRGSKTAANSGLIRKLAVKAKGRLWLAKLGKGWRNAEADFELPEGLEDQLDDLMGGLSDKDTIVRYSAAKYLARLSALLPASFSSQIVLATTGLFAGTEDEPIVETPFGTIIDPGGSSTAGGTMGFGGLETTRGEARWHGVCLALAEMARRGLISGEAVEEAVNWVVKALTFDLRRASHSIGSNVRDAAAYLLWSLSRACRPDVLSPYAQIMATSLVCVAVFDREVGVRRAASAAFQEGVGRLGLYPDGIDVLAKTDFYSVSVRRIAFSIAAPAVGAHQIYRDQMREHLHHITLRHWDTAMRTQGAAALKSLLMLGEDKDLSDSLHREIEQLPSLDAVNVHGALAALGEITALFPESDIRRQVVFESLSTIRPAALVSQQAVDILAATCNLITVTLNHPILSSVSATGVLTKYLDLAIKRREEEVHEALASVYGRLSELRNPDKDVNKLISDLKSFRISQRQAATLALGHIRYAREDMVDKVVKALLALLGDVKVDVESRRSAIRSLMDIAVQRSATADGGHTIISQCTLEKILKAMLGGLEDYTTDQRGDVGSWVRVASLKGLGVVLSSLRLKPSASAASDYTKDLVGQGLFERILSGIIKQSVEKLESVRGAAALALARLKDNGWQWDGSKTMAVPLTQLQDGSQGFRYIDQKEWFASTMPLLSTFYRPALVAGLVYSVGSQVLSLSNAALHPLKDHLNARNHLVALVLQDLFKILTENHSSNRIFVPALQTVHKLFVGSVLPVGGEKDVIMINLLNIGCKGIGGIKSIERITTSMRMVIACTCLPEDEWQAPTTKAIEYLHLFLAHRFPRIRAMAAEELYLALSTSDIEMDDELEEVLLETEWVSDDFDGPARSVVGYLRSASGQTA